jgi:hypothetical protein
VASLATLWISAARSMAEQNVPARKDTFLPGGALNRRLVTGQDPNAAARAAKYVGIFSLLLKHKKNITRVTFWGGV